MLIFHRIISYYILDRIKLPVITHLLPSPNDSFMWFILIFNDYSELGTETLYILAHLILITSRQ